MWVEKPWSLQSNLLIEQNQYHHEKKDCKITENLSGLKFDKLVKDAAR